MKVNLLLIVSSVVAGTVCAIEDNEKMRYLDPYLMTADRLLSSENANHCIEKLTCLLETDIAAGINNTLTYISRFLTNAHHGMKTSDFHKVEYLIHKYPHVSEIVDAIKLGKSSAGTNVCSTAFPACLVKAQDFISAARMLGNRRVATQARSVVDGVCATSSALCATGTVACGLCGIFTFGLCGLACAPEVAVGCGMMDFHCAIAG